MYFEERKRELMENIEIENEKRREQNELDLKNGVVDDTPPDHKNTLQIEDVTNEDTKINESSENIETETTAIDEPHIDELNTSSDTCDIKACNLDCVQNEILGHCPNSAETSSPSELMECMVNSTVIENPKSRWADEICD